MPLSLQGAGQDKLGIYVKSVVKGGAADVVSNVLKRQKFRGRKVLWKCSEILGLLLCANNCFNLGHVSPGV